MELKTTEKVNGQVYGLFCMCPTCRENRPGEVRYVGVTVKGVEKRFQDHVAEASRGCDRAKDRWIRKHGPKNIRHILLDEVDEVPELQAAEINWIRHLGAFKGAHGLNLTLGGEGVWGLEMSASAREKFRARTAKQMAVKHPRAKLTQEDVKEIIRRIWDGESAGIIAQDYPISTSAIQRIRSGKNWTDVPRPSGIPPRPVSHGAKRLPKSLIQQVKDEHTGEWGELKRLAAKFGISETSVSLIVNGHRG